MHWSPFSVQQSDGCEQLSPSSLHASAPSQQNPWGLQARGRQQSLRDWQGVPQSGHCPSGIPQSMPGALQTAGEQQTSPAAQLLPSVAHVGATSPGDASVVASGPGVTSEVTSGAASEGFDPASAGFPSPSRVWVEPPHPAPIIPKAMMQDRSEIPRIQEG